MSDTIIERLEAIRESLSDWDHPINAAAHIDEAIAEIERLRADLARVTQERDEARAVVRGAHRQRQRQGASISDIVERAKKAVQPHIMVGNGETADLLDALVAEVERLWAEQGDLLADLARVTLQRNQALWQLYEAAREVAGG